jgi:hypothetical protein
VGRRPVAAARAVPVSGLGERRDEQRGGESERRHERVGLHLVLLVTTRAQRGST